MKDDAELILGLAKALLIQRDWEKCPKCKERQHKEDCIYKDIEREAEAIVRSNEGFIH